MMAASLLVQYPNFVEKLKLLGAIVSIEDLSDLCQGA
jgi:hypothetical protein